MAIRPILIAPNPRLKVVCAPVLRVDDDVRRLFDDMLETMYAAPGIGLAAPQLGVARRMIVADVSQREGERAPHFLADPEIVSVSDETVLTSEGCLSFPDHYAEVERPARAVLRFRGYDDERHETEVDGLLARCLLHEIDHLDGVLFVDYLSKLKRDIILRKLQKLQRADIRAGA